MVVDIADTIQIAKPGGQVEIKCVVKTNKKVIKVVWEKDEGDVKHLITEETSPTKYCLKQANSLKQANGLNEINCNLTINNVENSDTAKYRCIVKYESKCSSNPTELEMDAIEGKHYLK